MQIIWRHNRYLKMSSGARQRKHRMVIVGSHVVDVSPLVQQKLNGAEMPRSRGFHQRRSTSFGLMLQIGSSAEQHVGHIRVSIFAGVRQGRVSSSRLSVDVSDGLITNYIAGLPIVKSKSDVLQIILETAKNMCQPRGNGRMTGIERSVSPLTLIKYWTSSRWPSCDASINGVEHPSSRSAPAFTRKSAT